MPFVLRQVTPVRLSRLPTDGPSSSSASLLDDPRQCISNQTLSACLRQLASLVSLATDIFTHCQDEASNLHERTVHLRQRLDRLQSNTDRLDSRTVPIPEGDLAAFSHDHKTNHFKSSALDVPAAAPTSQVPELNLVASSNRPKALVSLYDKAASLVSPPAVNRPDSLLGADGLDAADYGRLMALGATLRRRRKHRSNVLEIETRRPASLAHMREWLTDDEGVLDDLSAPVGPDNRRPIDLDHTDSAALHRLPSPEEKAKAAASQVFPAEMVRLDVTGSGFQRMTQFRRSLQHFEYADPSGVQPLPERARSRKRSKKKSTTKKRRNTIACDGDRRDIQDALAGRGNTSLVRNDGEKSGSRSSLRQRLNLVHLLRTSLMTTPSTGKASGSAVTSDMSYDESDNTIQSITTDATSHASSELVVQVTAGNLVTATRTRSGAMMNTISRLRRLGTDHTFVSGCPVQADIHLPPTTISSPAKNSGPSHQQIEPESDLYELIPSEKEFGTLGTARPTQNHQRGVKLRGSKESTDGRSSSGNWSASGSSCSTRTSLDSDHPRHHVSAASPLAQRHPRVIQQLHQQRSFSPEMDVDSALSGDDCSATTTSSIHRPDENGHNNPNELDLETSSVYSCDAEGYYTSFHIDSGLKTLKEGQSDGSLHKNRVPVPKETSSKGGDSSNRSSGLSSASGSVSGGQNSASLPENEYELFGKGSTLSNTTTSSAGTVIFRPDGATNSNSIGSQKKRNSQPPEPPPRNGSNRNSTTSTTVSLDLAEGNRKPEGVDNSRQLTEKESKEIADALKQLRNEDADTSVKSEASEEASRERIRAKTQIERLPAMCVVTPSITPLPSDDDHEGLRSPISLESHIQSTFLQHVAGSDVRLSAPRVNVANLPTPPAFTETPIVIKASIVKCPAADQELVALNQLVTTDNNEPTVQPFSSAGSSESSRSSSLERKKRGARVTLDSDGKVVYSSDSLKRRKAQAGHTTFESGQETRKLDSGTSAFRPNPIGSTTKPLSPPPYRPAPAFTGIRTAVRTQPDGQTAQPETRSAAGSPASTAMVSRSDSYRLANEDEVDNDVGSFQRNRSDSYRKANQATATTSVPVGRLGPLNTHSLSGFAANGNGTHQRPMTAGTGQYISGHLTDRQNGFRSTHQSRPVSAQPPCYVVKSPMLVKQMSNPGFMAGQIINGGGNGRPSRQYPSNHGNGVNGHQQQPQHFYNRQISSPAMMMTSSPLLVKPSVNPNVAGRRMYGGPRLLINPKILPGGVNHNNNKSGSISSLNSSGSGLDISMTGHKKSNGFNGVPPSPVVRPPTNLQDRPSFFNTPDGAGTSRMIGGSSSGSPLPGYQSLSPPPRMSALPLAQLSDSEFQRKDFRYNSLPARFKTAADYYASTAGHSSFVEPDYNQWLPSAESGNKKGGSTIKNNGGRDSPEEGGFLEFNNNTSATCRQQGSNSSSSSTSSAGNIQQGSSPTPSFSSCSLDGSFTSSLNESVDARPGISWPIGAAIGSPHHPPGMVVHSVGLIKRTTISDFKRKLLQLHHPVQKKMSAVEQLKATQPPPAGIKGPSPDVSPVTKHPALENLIRRSARVSYIASRLSQQQRNNRFQNSPRTDVLSATIAEGRSEEELAAELADDAVTVSSASSGCTTNNGSVRRHLSFQHPRRGSSTPSSGSSTPIETSL